MKLQAVLVYTLLSVLVMNTQGKILKKLLKKKLALIPILAGAKHKLGSGNGSGSGSGGHRGSSNELIVPQADNSFGQIIPQQSNLIDESSLVEQVHPVPASVAVYNSYAPEFRTPAVYYRAARPVVRRTVYEYVEDSSRNNDNVETLSGNGGSSSTPGASNIPNIPSIPGLSNIPGILGISSIPGLSNLSGLQSIKNVASRTLTGLAASLQQPIQAPRPASPTVTTYVSYPPYY